MTRKELIKSYEYRLTKAETEAMDSLYPTDDHQREREGFAKGVEWCRGWMESNPHWRPYPEEKPKHGGEYFTMNRNGRMRNLPYFAQKQSFYNDESIIAWTDMPKLPNLE